MFETITYFLIALVFIETLVIACAIGDKLDKKEKEKTDEHYHH
jgi:hypothetical protein